MENVLFFMPMYMTKPVKLSCAHNDVKNNSYGFLRFLIVLLGNMNCQDSENCFLNQVVTTHAFLISFPPLIILEMH